MNCKQCGKKIGIFSRIKVGEDYLCKDCHKKVREESNQWNRAGRKKVSDEWIRKTLEEIALLDPNKKEEQAEEKETAQKTEQAAEPRPGADPHPEAELWPGANPRPEAKPQPGVKYSKSRIDKVAGKPHPQMSYGPLMSERPTAQFSLSDAAAVSKEFSKFNGAQASKTFQQMLLGLIKDRGMTNPEFYNAAMIDRKLFSTIKNNANYKPKKETAVACCFGLNLSLKEAEKLLEAAGYKLSLAILWDRIIYFCLDHRITDLDIVNELLYEEKQKCIGVIE